MAEKVKIGDYPEYPDMSNEEGKTALIIVDMQNDFMPPAGALPVPGAHEIIKPIAKLADSDRYKIVIASKDWHSAYSPVESKRPTWDREGKGYPKHCIQEQPGSHLVKELWAAPHIIVHKTETKEKDAFSAFLGKSFGFRKETLQEALERLYIERLTIVGVALDVCVLATALDGRKKGYKVTVLEKYTRPVTKRGGTAAIKKLKKAGVRVR